MNITDTWEFRMKRTNYVRYVKGAISNIFGKVNIGKISRHKG